MDQKRYEQFQRMIAGQQKNMLEQIQRLAGAADAERYWQAGDEILSELQTVREMLDTVERSLVTSAPAPRKDLNYTGLLAIGSPEKSDGLVSMSEVMDLLTDNGCNFTDLAPIRARYEMNFGTEQCWSYPFCDGHLGGVILPVQEGALYLPYDGIDSDTYEQFVVEDAYLLDKEKALQLRKLLDTRYMDLSSALSAIEHLPPHPQENSAIQNILAGIDMYIRMSDYPVVERMPMNDLNRELIKAMTEEQGSPVYLGTYYSDELVPYTGQTIYNAQYNFCLPTHSEELQELLREGIDKPASFDKFYQLLHSLGGHVLLWV